MDPKYGMVVNGKLELTPEGHKFLQDGLISAALSVPGPIVTLNYAAIERVIDAVKLKDKYRALMSPGTSIVTSSMTGRMNVPRPPYTQTLKNPGGVVDKPKIPVSGMHGFSEQGTPEDWDLAIGEVYGYRWWKLLVPARFAGYLEAPEKTLSPDRARIIGAHYQPWDAGVQEAVCPASALRVPSWNDLIEGRAEPFKHEPPEVRESCGCGFWAYFDQFLPVTSHFGNLGSGKPYRTYDNMVEIPVFGVIKGSGRVIIGEKGFRCQFAEIVGLALPEIAQTQLSWNTLDWQVGIDRYHHHSVRNSTFYQAAMGGPGWYADPGVRATQTQEAPRDEVMGRIAFIEGLLSTVYPDAKIMCNDTALRAYFPPDKKYS